MEGTNLGDIDLYVNDRLYKGYYEIFSGNTSFIFDGGNLS
jgi:hypothetical protein